MSIWRSRKGSIEKRIKDIDALIAKLREHNITPIARVVCFKDDSLANKRPELAVMHKNGEIWTGLQGTELHQPLQPRGLGVPGAGGGGGGPARLPRDPVRLRALPQRRQDLRSRVPGAVLEQRGRHRRLPGLCTAAVGEAGRVGVGRRLRHDGQPQNRTTGRLSARRSRRSARTSTSSAPWSIRRITQSGSYGIDNPERQPLRD